MNSVYGRLIFWALITVVVGFVVVIAIGMMSEHRAAADDAPDQVDSLVMDDAIAAYRAGGPRALGEQMERVNRHFNQSYFLTDLDGRDLATGEARLPGPQDHGRHAHVYATPDPQYKLVVYDRHNFHYSVFVPYHGLLIVTVLVLCAALGANLASPLRRLAQTVERFGSGDFSARVRSTRKDEIGEVGRAFDRMADRISTLLTAERRLLQDVSHELRSPLARLSFAAELARTAPDREAAVGRLKREIARLADLVGALIQMTRAEGDPEAAEFRALRLDGLLQSVVEDCRFEAAQRPCRIEVRGSLPEAPLRGNIELLRRAIENVLRNAMRYTAPESSIEVALEAEAAWFRMSIRDYGPGVPEDALEKIFSPFFRLDEARDSATGGVGLGLAIAQRAVALHHGRLKAENANPGLRVWIELPR